MKYLFRFTFSDYDELSWHAESLPDEVWTQLLFDYMEGRVP